MFFCPVSGLLEFDVVWRYDLAPISIRKGLHRFRVTSLVLVARRRVELLFRE